MKFLLAQPSVLRFQWELDVVLTNIRSLDSTTPIVVLFTEDNMDVVKHISSRYENLEVHHYSDERTDKTYHPTTRPYLIWRYLKEDSSREKQTYFQIDSDVIFRELPDFQKLDTKYKTCIGSDCSGYINHDYLITRTNGQAIVDGFAEILNIDTQVIKETPGIGAQWLISGMTAQMWWHIWKDSDLLYRFLTPLDSDVQKWTAEMWAQLYNLAKHGYDISIDPELDFCRPTDDIKLWDTVKILHNAGVTISDRTLFYKGKYVYKTPFNENFNWVRKDKASLKYVEAIKQVRI